VRDSRHKTVRKKPCGTPGKDSIKIISTEVGYLRYGLDLSDRGYGTVAGSCEQCNELKHLTPNIDYS
jgi:hypothetical protein